MTDEFELKKAKPKKFYRKGGLIEAIQVVSGRLHEIEAAIKKASGIRRDLGFEIVDGRSVIVTDLFANKTLFKASVGDYITIEPERNTLLRWSKFSFDCVHRK